MPTAKPKGRGSTAAKQRKAEIVARGIVAGKNYSTIAREAGCSPRHVQKLASEQSTKIIISELLAPHRAQLARMIAPALAAIGRAMKAKKTSKEDHYAQLNGVDRLGRYLEMAQGKLAEEAPAGHKQITWEEFLVLYHGRKQTTEGGV